MSSTEQRRRRRENRGRQTAKNDDDTGLITQLRSKEKPCRGLSRASAKPRVATGVTGRQEKVAGNVA